MNMKNRRFSTFFEIVIVSILFLFTTCDPSAVTQDGLVIGEMGYFEMPGLNVLVFDNTYSEGHQGGVEIIQHGDRVATAGNLRLSPAPGQWQPVPKIGEGFEKRGPSPLTVGIESRVVDTVNNIISIPCSYPDSSRNREGFNPVIYPDVSLSYTVSVQAEGRSFTITVNLDEPIPDGWVGKVGYNIELFPGNLYGKTYAMDSETGIFPRQAAGPTYKNDKGEDEAAHLAEGNTLVVAPESDLFRMKIESDDPLMLLDGSLKHNNGWFVVRTLIPAGATKEAIKWTITPNVIDGWKEAPMVHVSQVGYHPEQNKVAYVEMDKRQTDVTTLNLKRILPDGGTEVVKSASPEFWGKYLRYNYATFDFSEIKDPGAYIITYGDFTTNPFRIDNNVLKRHVWQPTLEYFIPTEMCHMRVNQKYRIWHGLCHMDDALMAPLNIKHFDGYNNTRETGTLSKFEPLDHVPNLNVGGWHDASDYDLRIESQTAATLYLALAFEEFGVEYDETMIDQENKHVEIHSPDGKPDILQQVEHGVLTMLNGYHELGRLYRGIICPTLRQYVHLGDGSTMTDNKVFSDKALLAKANQVDELWYKKVANRYSKAFDPELNLDQIELFIPELDDRLVFTETNPSRQLYGVAGLAAASRVLKEYDAQLAAECLSVAEELWQTNKSADDQRSTYQKIQTLSELILATNKEVYKAALCELTPSLEQAFGRYGWTITRVLPMIDCDDFKNEANKAAQKHKTTLEERLCKSPFGAPLERVEYVGLQQYFLHKAWPEMYTPDVLFNIVNFQLGCRPGKSMNTLVSGVGVNSPTIAYGPNRADWSYVPGGTFWNAVNLVRPDLPEDKEWPYLWTEREYIIGGATVYMFTILAADHMLDQL